VRFGIVINMEVESARSSSGEGVFVQLEDDEHDMLTTKKNK
jgi:hypothetical protein